MTRGTRSAPPAAADAMLTSTEILAALERGALEVHYQPVVLLPARHVVGFEALARLRAPDGQVVPPARFIPEAERSGVIVPLGHAVLEQAVAEAARWRAGPSLLSTATVSVNVAPAQLEDRGFVTVVRNLLDARGVPGSAIILEITESAATSPAVRPLLERLSALGVRIALDDFGTGFATLDNLRRLPVQVLKLDRSFVAGVTRAGADRAIVRVTIDLAESLGLSVIAEGVETEQQADALVRLGCHAVQGFLLARPDPQPERAAAAVARSRVPEATAVRGQDERWDADVDAAVLAAARLLALPGDRERAALHTLVCWLAGRLGWPEVVVRTAGRLALVHDLHRLTVDGVLPLGLRGAPLLARLAAELGPPARAEQEPELALVHWTLEVVRAAAGTDPALGPDAISVALRDRLRRRAPQAAPGVDAAAAVATLAAQPPELPALDVLLSDLDQRRSGRRGMEERLRSLVGITRVLSSSRDTRELLRVALEEVRRIVGAASGSLERWERESGRLRCLVNVGRLGPDEQTFPTDELYAIADYPQARRLMLSGVPSLYTVDDEEADAEEIALLRRLHKYSSAAIPVYLEGRLWGQIWLTTGVGEPPFVAGDIELLTSVATLVAGVVVQAENLERVSRTAFEDPLTRVGNRRALDDALETLSAAGEPVVVALLDVDLLKQLNDTAGHDRGDQALIDVADLLSHLALSWTGATVGRLGGDEFAVVLPRERKDRVLTAIRRSLARLETDGGPGVSVGAVSAHAPWTPRAVLAAADEQLFAAKARSRTRRP